MKRKRIYVSIPITGLDYETQVLRAAGIRKYLSHFYDEVVIPIENGVPDDAHPSVHMRADFKLLLDCDAIYMVSGWEDSSGCVAEFQVARHCHMDIKYESLKSMYYR